MKRKTRQDKTRHDTIRQDETRRYKSIQDKTTKTRQDEKKVKTDRVAHSATRLCTHECEPQTGGKETVLCQAVSCKQSTRLNVQGAKAPGSIALAIFETRKVPFDDEVACPIEYWKPNTDTRSFLIISHRY